MSAFAYGRVGLAVALGLQALCSWLLMEHLRNQLNPDAVVYGRAAQLWFQGDLHLAVNATWGVLASWVAVPGLALGMDPPHAVRATQVLMALIATLGTHALLGCFAMRVGVQSALVVGAALYATSASTMYITSDAAYVATYVWVGWALLTSRERILGLPRPCVAGALAGLSYLARPMGLPMGLALLVGAELMRCTEDGWSKGRRALGLGACGWLVVAGPWITVLSLHYGEFTTSHSPRIVHAAVGPRTDHPWNLPSFTRLHRPPEGRITSWEDPSTVMDPALRWSPLESLAAWQHQVRLVQRNLRAIVAEVIAFDAIGVVLLALIVLPLAAWRRPRPGVGWREPWLASCALLLVTALAPLHVERRYLWPLVPIGLAAVGCIASRLGGTTDTALAPGRSSRILTAIALTALLAPNVLTSTMRAAVLLVTPARQEKGIAERWAEALMARNVVGPVVSWTPHAWKALDPEGLYLAWMLGQPWLANIATDGRDLGAAAALGARVLVAKTLPEVPRPPAWIGNDWTVVETTDVRGTTLRDGRYWLLTRR